MMSTLHLSVRRCQGSETKELAIGKRLDTETQKLALPAGYWLCGAGACSLGHIRCMRQEAMQDQDMSR